MSIPRLHITNELRLRRATRGSGEHRRKALRSLEACRIVSKSIASSSVVDAPASQLLNVIGKTQVDRLMASIKLRAKGSGLSR